MDDAAGQSGGRTARREPKKKYLEMLQKVADREISEICIELDDLETFEKGMEDESLRLVENIEVNAKHYIEILSLAVDKVMPRETQEIS